MNKLAVVALGGNALLRGNQIGTVEEQTQNTIDTLENLIFLVKEGYDVIGVHRGYKGLFSDQPDVQKFNFALADKIFSRGGSTLVMSRFKPKDSDFRPDFFKSYNVKLLVTIGGDDTASTASRLTK